MTEYRIYFIDRTDHVSRPPEVIECISDVEAIQKARQFVDGQDIELWEGARIIVRLPRK